MQYLRQLDLLTPGDLAGLDVDIVGAGALGGAILLCLGKMGFGVANRITVTDFDRCEEHNLPTQWFRAADVLLKRSKVAALKDMADWMLDREIQTVDGRFSGDEERPVGPIVIVAVDSREERQKIWEKISRREDVRFLVDARAGAEVGEVRALDLRHDPHDEYARSLEGEPLREPCTRQAISFTALGVASFVGSVVKSWVRREDYPRSFVFDFRNLLGGSGPS
jgi:molybdopterin/thiamine biosynthesis adenylyltransferase